MDTYTDIEAADKLKIDIEEFRHLIEWGALNLRSSKSQTGEDQYDCNQIDRLAATIDRWAATAEEKLAEGKKMYTLEEAAAKLNTSPEVLLEWEKSEKLSPAVKKAKFKYGENQYTCEGIDRLADILEGKFKSGKIVVEVQFKSNGRISTAWWEDGIYYFEDPGLEAEIESAVYYKSMVGRMPWSSRPASFDDPIDFYCAIDTFAYRNIIIESDGVEFPNFNPTDEDGNPLVRIRL